MTRDSLCHLLLGGALLLAGCGGTTEPGGNPLDCSTSSLTTLAVGEHVIIDAAQCRLRSSPRRRVAAGPNTSTRRWLRTGRRRRTARPPTSSCRGVLRARQPRWRRARVRPSAGGRGRAGPSGSTRCCGRGSVRCRSRRDAPSSTGGRLASVAAAKPSVGDKRTFDVCATTDCNDFVQSTATAKVVGNKVAIFLDDTVPAGGYLQADLDKVGALFDSQLYPIDTTAFGRESDLDNNSVVIVLLTPKVNALSADCNTTGSVILGYFFGLDLLPPSSTPTTARCSTAWSPIPATARAISVRRSPRTSFRRHSSTSSST